VAQLEHRVEQIEEFLRPFREGRSELPIPVKSFSLSLENDIGRTNGSSVAASERSAADKLPSHDVNHTNHSAANEMGEEDTSEDSIDGMAAINFQHEQDAGFFGRLLRLLLLFRNARCST